MKSFGVDPNPGKTKKRQDLTKLSKSLNLDILLPLLIAYFQKLEKTMCC